MRRRQRVAVVGAGISGMAAAYALAKAGAEVVVYEKEDYLGGHAKTVAVDGVDVDLGFILFNRVTYPNMMELFESLGVEMERSDMSFSVSLDGGKGCEWGSRSGFSGLFAQKSNAFNPHFWRMLREIIKFKEDVLKYLEEYENNPDLGRDETLEQFITSHGYSQLFQKAYLNLGSTGLPFLVTLNPPRVPDHTLLKWRTGHPVPSVAASKASLELNQIQGKRGIWFCGAYQGRGFHEDGLKVATEVDLGFADAYIHGYISFVNEQEGLLDFFLILIANRDLRSTSNSAIIKRGWWTPLLLTAGPASARYFFRHILRQNTVTQARRNISRHYDLSNDFFSLFLDETMTYSCAIFKIEKEDLKVAQLRKLHLLIEKARIDGKQEVLDIGCGWGSLAIEVAKRTSCKYTGITLSEEQLKYATKKVKEAGLQDRITFLLCDYRQLPKSHKYDRIISCEMIEGVGHEYMEEFLAVVNLFSLKMAY
uniref:Cyclopropane-fatty-acyl-phospholipid synthase n=1 Tax=Ananas comosus var. bracteatus TaxID=296719 RepID=A0A6V7QCH6_ANACO|nr:unnamed protein product [Ananas comosus var. bracteatus]